MKWFGYHCRSCGDFDVADIAQDTIDCRCGRVAKRKFQIGVIGSSLKTSDRWDPVVGQYVKNDGHFRSLLAQGQEAQSEKLGMDVKLATYDARDQEAAAELHGHSLDQRHADLEQSPK
jgi:hypothetical protein